MLQFMRLKRVKHSLATTTTRIKELLLIKGQEDLSVKAKNVYSYVLLSLKKIFFFYNLPRYVFVLTFLCVLESFDSLVNSMYCCFFFLFVLKK